MNSAHLGGNWFENVLLNTIIMIAHVQVLMTCKKLDTFFNNRPISLHGISLLVCYM